MQGTTIKDYMVPTPHTIGEDIVLSQAREKMHKQQVRHLPVLYGGKLVGVLSDRDIKLALSIHPSARDLKVGDIMSEEPYSVSEDKTMAEVLAQMAIHKYGCAVVTDEKGKAVGIFTATDAVRLLSDFFFDEMDKDLRCYEGSRSIRMLKPTKSMEL